MELKNDVKYAKSHEWVKELDTGVVEIGITDFAQEALGDIVFVNLPEVGDDVTMGEAFTDVESVKAVSDIFSPVSGSIYEVNEALADNPALINEAPYDAWIIRVRNVTDVEALLTGKEYEAFTEEEG